MEITQQLVNKFFRQECTPEENDFISKYFDEHPGEIDKCLAEEDWHSFEPGAQLHPAISQNMLDVIEQSIGVLAPEKRFNKKPWLIAASITVLVGLGALMAVYLLKNNTQKANPGLASLSHSQQYNDTVSNKTDNVVTGMLPDGSKVLLSAHSEIYYHKPFTQKQRDIFLKGEAIFKVAKDKTRPFTVYAANLSTTALGTCFKVSAFTPDEKISVKLYEGKVVIKHQHAQLHEKDVYLTPGLELNWSAESNAWKVAKFNNNTDPLSTSTHGNDALPVVNNNSGTIKFNNEQLSSVLKQLRQFYHISINADENTLADKYFTGNINKHTDAADDVLRTIATLNKFSLKVQGGVYTLVPNAGKTIDSLTHAGKNE